MRILIAGLAMFILAGATQGMIHVPGDQPTIQAGIDVAADGDTVLVQPGAYVETIDYGGRNVLEASTYLTTGDTSLVAATVIDADSLGSCVELTAGESDAALAGFTLINGFADFGGGFNCLNAVLELDRVVVSNCAGQFGGGMFFEGGQLTADQVVFEGNQAFYGSGGGIYFSDAMATVENAVFRNNSGGHGGGIQCSQTGLTLENVEFTDNEAGFGGGLSCWYSSEVSVNNAVICGNSVQISGGGVNVRTGATLILENAVVMHNEASYGGGVNVVGNTCEGILEYVTVASNTAWTSGGGLQCGDQAVMQLTNSTVQGNSAGHWGDGLYAYHAHAVSHNSIIWDNVPEEVYFQDSGDPSSITVACSDIRGAEDGIVTNGNGTVFWQLGNFDQDPLFCAPGAGDFSLAAASPCLPGNHPEGFDCDLIGAHGLGCETPAAPVTDLSITVSDGVTIELSWSVVAGAAGYRVYRFGEAFAPRESWELVSEQSETGYSEILLPDIAWGFYSVTALSE